ncbi:MAG: hypothetical protein ACRYFZ_14285 [Janthinobacterium lividum]
MPTSFVVPAPAPAPSAPTAAKSAVPTPGIEVEQAALNWLWVLFLLGTAAFSLLGPTCAWH